MNGVRRAGRWIGVLVAVAGCGACNPPAPGRPDVLLVTIDTLRADHLGAYGYERETSPTIDRLAAEGAMFEVAYAPMGTTCPSHATLFTSRSPLAHGLVRNGLALAAEESTLAERLADAGFTTGAFVSSYPLKRRFGLAQGFGHYDDDFSSATATMEIEQWEGRTVEGKFDRRAEVTADAALAWRDAQREPGPLFVWVHLFDPHAPHLAPPGHATRFIEQGQSRHERMVALYDAEIRYADEHLGRLVRAFEAAAGRRGLLLALASDHGEGLFDHGHFDHNRYLYEEELRVPLLFRWPGRIPQGTRPGVPAELRDVAPTLQGLLGIEELEGSLDGRDWSGRLLGAPAHAARGQRPLWLVSPSYPDRPRLLGVRLGDWKWIGRPGKGPGELYDLSQDPGEQRNLAELRPGRVRAFASRAESWREQELAKLRGDAAVELQPEDREALRALGYVE